MGRFKAKAGLERRRGWTRAGDSAWAEMKRGPVTAATWEEQSLGRTKEGRKALGTEQIGGRREREILGRGGGHWCGKVGITGRGQETSFGSYVTEAEPGGGQKLETHTEGVGRGSVT